MKSVYILESLKQEGRFYIGVSEEPIARLADHNAGRSPYTSKLRPWKLRVVLAFDDPQRAYDFERYLKSASGRAFAKKRL